MERFAGLGLVDGPEVGLPAGLGLAKWPAGLGLLDCPEAGLPAGLGPAEWPAGLGLLDCPEAGLPAGLGPAEWPAGIGLPGVNLERPAAEAGLQAVALVVVVVVVLVVEDCPHPEGLWVFMNKIKIH